SNIVGKLLGKNPDDRFQSCEDLLSALGEAGKSAALIRIDDCDTREQRPDTDDTPVEESRLTEPFRPLELGTWWAEDWTTPLHAGASTSVDSHWEAFRPNLESGRAENDGEAISELLENNLWDFDSLTKHPHQTAELLHRALPVDVELV